MLISEIIAAIEAVAPRAWQEDWDNTGLQVGNAAVECTGVLIAVDVTPAVVDEAIRRGCNLIVSHHPLIFRGLKQLTGRTPVQVSVMNAIAAGVSIYSSHTALDSAPGGVSYRMADMLGVDVRTTLSPLRDRWLQLNVMVPRDHAESVRLALFDAGAGTLGNYDCCSFTWSGSGTFAAKPGANPYVGVVGQLHTEPEDCVSVLVPAWLKDKVVDTMLQVHPYEMPAYQLLRLDNPMQGIGLGVVGTLRQRMRPAEFIDHVKRTFGAKVARCTPVHAAMDSDTLISRVALCGGSGGEFIGDAVAQGAQAYVTADIRYHDFVDRQSDILLVDIGHFETEQCTKDIFYQIISQKFANFAVYKSEDGLNPVNYM